MSTPVPELILQALAHGIHGNPERGLHLIQPLVDEGPRSTYALLGALAETASRQARETRDALEVGGTDVMFGIEIEGPEGLASAQVLPAPLRFAVQFVTAWANRDQDTAHALFWALAEPSDRLGTDDLATVIGIVFDMAVLGAEATLIERRTRTGDTPQ